MTDPAFYEIKSWQKKHLAMLKGSPESNSVDIPTYCFQSTSHLMAVWKDAALQSLGHVNY